MDITLLFSDPFYTGEGGPSRNVPWPYPVALDGRGYALDLRYYSRETIDVFREARDSQALPGEGTLNPEGAWKRTRDDWSLGAGQLWADRDLSSERRFYSSRGVDIWSQPNELCLLPEVWTPAADNSTQNTKLLSTGNYLYATGLEDDTVQWTTDPSADPIVWADEDLGGEILDMTTDGEHVYVSVDGGGIESANLSGAFSAMGGDAATFEATVLEFANGYLFAAEANELHQVNADGSMALVKDHFNDLFVWSTIAGSPSWIYAGGNATGLSEIYRFGVFDDTGDLSVPIHAMTLPRGEVLLTMTFYGGRMLLGTTKGLRIATIESDGGLSHGPLIDIGHDVECFAAEGQFVWFGWTDYDEDAPWTGLGRANLQEFTEPEVPAYASDLMYPGTGAVEAVARHAGRTFFAVADVGLCTEVVDLAQGFGEINLGRFRWGTFEPKIFLGMELVHNPLVGSVVINLRLDDGSSVEVGSHTEADSTGVGEITGVGRTTQVSDWFEVILTIEAVDGVGPCVLRSTVRALPVPKQVDKFVLPLIIAQTTNLGELDGDERRMDVKDEFDYIHGLHSRGVPIIYQEGRSSYTVTVRKVQFGEPSNVRWDAEKDGFEGILFVTVVTAEI